MDADGPTHAGVVDPVSFHEGTNNCHQACDNSLHGGGPFLRTSHFGFRPTAAKEEKKIVGLMIVVCTHGRSLLYVFRINERFIPAFVFHYEQLTVMGRNNGEEGQRGLSHLRRMLEPEIRADFFLPAIPTMTIGIVRKFFLLLPRTTFCKNLLFTFELQDANSIGHENEMWFFWLRRGTGADAGWGSSPVAECGDFFFPRRGQPGEVRKTVAFCCA